MLPFLNEQVVLQLAWWFETIYSSWILGFISWHVHSRAWQSQSYNIFDTKSRLSFILESLILTIIPIRNSSINARQMKNKIGWSLPSKFRIITCDAFGVVSLDLAYSYLVKYSIELNDELDLSLCNNVMRRPLAMIDWCTQSMRNTFLRIQ